MGKGKSKQVGQEGQSKENEVLQCYSYVRINIWIPRHIPSLRKGVEGTRIESELIRIVSELTSVPVSNQGLLFFLRQRCLPHREPLSKTE